LIGHFLRGEGTSAFQSVLDRVVGRVDAFYLVGNGPLLLGDPFLERNQFFLEDGSGGFFDPLANSLPAVPDLLVGAGAFSFSLAGEDFLGELAELIETVAEGLREDLSFILCLFLAGGCLLSLGLLGDCLGFASHKNYLKS
jgi:hypothetical protein